MSNVPSKKADILERLRRKTIAGMPVFPTPIELEAADEIEQLRAAGAALLAYLDEHDWGLVPEGATADRLHDLCFPAKTPDPFRQWADAEVEKITDEEVARRLATETEAPQNIIEEMKREITPPVTNVVLSSFQGYPQPVYKANTPICEKCGQIEVRIPRLGIYHVCPELPDNQGVSDGSR
jgi:hypothetical protein